MILKLNTSHEIIRAMISLESEQDALKDKSNFAKSFKRMSAGIKLLGGSNAKQCLEIVAENIGIHDEKHLKEVSPPIKRPKVKCSSNDANTWMKKHGYEINPASTEIFTYFLKEFFTAIDEDSNGTLSSSEIIIPLLSLGLSNNSHFIEKALVHISGCEKIEDIQLDKEQFIGFFKGDRKTDVILKNLDAYCKTMLKEEENKKIAQHMASNRSSYISSQYSLSIGQYVEKKKYPTAEEFIRILKKWWKEISNGTDCVNISKVADFLVEKGMAGNKHEGRAIAKSSELSHYLTYNTFEKIFFKPILKASLYNVAVFLQNSDFEEFSMKLKLAIIQRKHMMTGARTRADASARQGRITLQALDSYRKNNGIDISKSIRATRTSIEAAEELNEERIMNLLYKLKDRAKKFLNTTGDVDEKIKNPWDIRTKLNYNEDFSPSPKFKEENYLNSFAEIPNIAHSSEPYNRKVRIFRENYLYKKFNKMIKIYPNNIPK